MPQAFFTSDLHGRPDRYAKLLAAVAAERPAAVFLGGDLFPHALAPGAADFAVEDFRAHWQALRDDLGPDYPAVFLILGNDDPYVLGEDLGPGQKDGLWQYVHRRAADWQGDGYRYQVLGYNCVPPTPFRLKDWERYDVSRFTDPGCVPPDEGIRTDGLTPREIGLTTIKQELAEAAQGLDPARTICLFHSPPYRSVLDRAALDGRLVDHVPLDVNVGSIAVRDFILARQPLLTLHGHVHESVRLTGDWRQEFGRTRCFGGAHDGPQLPLVRLDPADLDRATRQLL